MTVSDVVRAYRIWCERNEKDFRVYWDQLNLQIEILIRNIDEKIFEGDGYGSDMEQKSFSDKPTWISDQTVELTLKGLIRIGIERMTYRYSSHDAAQAIYDLAKQLSIIQDDDLSDILDI